MVQHSVRRWASMWEYGRQKIPEMHGPAYCITGVVRAGSGVSFFRAGASKMIDHLGMYVARAM